MSALAPTLQAFFTDRLMAQRHASEHTVAAYRDTWRLLLNFPHPQRSTHSDPLLCRSCSRWLRNAVISAVSRSPMSNWDGFWWRRDAASTAANIRNEVDRYISWPGQAVAYLIGRREIQRLRSATQARLGARFDLRVFHGVVLGNGRRTARRAGRDRVRLDPGKARELTPAPCSGRRSGRGCPVVKAGVVGGAWRRPPSPGRRVWPATGVRRRGGRRSRSS
jgi:hypothetical protein